MEEEREVFFESDGYRLAGVLHLPNADRPPVVAGSHGLFADGDSPKQQALARELTARGIAFLRFHHRGCGKSSGSFSQATTLSGRVGDLSAALDFLDAQPGLGTGRGLFGSSLGATACLVLALGMERPPGVMVGNAPPARGRDLAQVLSRDPRTGSLSAAFFREMEALDLLAGPLALKNTLVIHGDADEVVPVDHGQGIHRRLEEPKRLVILPSGDHPMSDPGHQARFLEESVEWFARFLLEGA
ncbi:MAG: alpha/beta hydrolase [Proteobacteria bacterium]|nr:alpha/beta hydrolase [Pseudomonadota bacterium]